MSNATDIPETVMVDRCAGCALRPGTDAANSWWTQAVFKLCVLAGEPFECHDQGAGHLCKGFVDAFEAKVAEGYYANLPDWKHQLYLNLNEVLQNYREAVNRGEPFNDMAALSDAVSRITDDSDPTLEKGGATHA